MNVDVHKFINDRMKITLRLTGVKSFTFRIRIATMIIKCACRLFCVNVNVVMEGK